MRRRREGLPTEAKTAFSTAFADTEIVPPPGREPSLWNNGLHRSPVGSASALLPNRKTT
ncbi:hypothetical protein HMPREF0262_03322 [Clostridium sp. ATCC 29733]|nr:hypothetical protein HMPREF0262_03322 [Clostridium sp. ATCC 29733]